MKTMGISEFKARCIQVLKDLREQQSPLIITHRGRPLARIEPVIRAGSRRKLGALRHLGTIRGEIVQTNLEDDWEMERV